MASESVLRRVYLVGEQAYAGSPEGPLRAGSAAQYLKSRLGFPIQPEPEPALAAASTHIQHAGDAAFCLLVLLPLLRELALQGAGSAPALPAVDETLLGDLQQRAADLGRALPRPTSRPALRRRLGIPCMFIGDAVVPLEAVPRQRRSDLAVIVNRQAYRHRLSPERRSSGPARDPTWSPARARSSATWRRW
jgi:hypothetical protein